MPPSARRPSPSPRAEALEAVQRRVGELRRGASGSGATADSGRTEAQSALHGGKDGRAPAEPA